MKLKVALFYDWLNQWGGAERVLLDLIEMFPGAVVYTLVWDKRKTNWLPKKTKVMTSFIDKLPFSKNNPIYYTGLYPLAAEQFDFSDYDLVLSTTSTVGQCLLTPVGCKFVCYMHNINRHVYSKKYPILEGLLKLYRRNDSVFGQRPDLILCNSKTVAARIFKVYRREAKIIYPGVDVNKFNPSSKIGGDYYLVVSRLVDHKRIDLAIEACKVLGRKLIIVGKGRQESKLKQLSFGSAIELLGKIDDQTLIKLYQNCRGLICPQEEDFGLTPVEAQLCGKGVIAFNRGGITETVVEGKTGVFFEEQTVDKLINAIKRFEKLTIKSIDCRQNAIRFSKESFMLNFKQAVYEKQ